MHENILFVLGAGFSAHAGIPLVQQLRQRVFDWLEAKKETDPKIRVHMHASDWFQNGQFWAGLQTVDPKMEKGFEELMIELLEAAATNSQHPAGLTERILRYACGRVLWEHQKAFETAPLPVAYSNFAQHARNSKGIVSFNWDLVCESSLERAGVPWGYRIQSPVPVIKPHGSLNYSDHRQSGLRPELDLYSPIAVGSSLSYMAGNPFEDPLAPHNENLRYMLFPGDPEQFLSGENDIEQKDRTLLWTAVKELASTASKIIFIGYSLPLYDHFAREFLKHACDGKAVEVCNPADEVFDVCRKVLTTSTLITQQKRFEDSSYAG